MTTLSSLRVRLIVLVLIAVIPAFALIVVNAMQERQHERAAVREDAVRLTQITAAQQGQFVEGARQLLATLAGLTQAADLSSVDPVQCGAALAGIMGGSSRYANIGIADANGAVFCSAVPSGPAEASDRTWFRHAVETKDFAVGDYQIGRITNKAAVNFGYPVIGPDGSVKGVIYAALDLGWVNEFAAGTDLPRDATLTIIDGQGVILARYPDPEQWVGTTVPDVQATQDTIAQRETLTASGVDGVQRLYAFAPLTSDAGSGAYIRVGLSTATAYAPLNQKLVRNLSLLGAVALLALLAAWFGGDWFVLRGVRVLMRTSRRVAEGDLTARTGLHRDRGEIGLLARGFDDMTAALQRREAQRKVAEERLSETVQNLERSNGELEQFAYVASHDLQEPLRMVGNYTQLLARRYQGRLDSDADEFIQYAVDGAKRMQELINDLLSFSRVGTRGNEPAPTDTEAVLSRTLHDLSGAIEDAGAVVTNDPLPVVMADDVQLGQLLQNLIGNGIKFRSDGLPRIHISAQPDGDSHVFTVEDNGIGISEDYFDRIFAIFQRLNERERYPGNGIGLAVCKKIIERHGGRIWVESEPGRGARFRFTLPAAVQQRAAA